MNTNMMMLLLSSAGPAPALWGNVVVIGFGVASGVAAMVSVVSVFATRREVMALEKALDTERVARGELREEFREELAALRTGLTEAKTGVAGLVSHVDTMNQTMATAMGRLDRMLERLPK
jgi:hypothetical protein